MAVAKKPVVVHARFGPNWSKSGPMSVPRVPPRTIQRSTSCPGCWQPPPAAGPGASRRAPRGHRSSQSSRRSPRAPFRLETARSTATAARWCEQSSARVGGCCVARLPPTRPAACASAASAQTTTTTRTTKQRGVRARLQDGMRVSEYILFSSCVQRWTQENNISAGHRQTV
eukprot:SAG31_NODE_7047_length_1803_cov_2.544282_2_plen_172_part_00